MRRSDCKVWFSDQWLGRAAIPILLLQLLNVALAQQYTAVKLISSNEEQRTVPAHSARSVDGGIPTGDSNIINLSIKPLARGQGFSAAKGRNLGFVNDPALNSIPAGINNELSNGDVRASTAQPNAGLRDSYGNPVTPFADLTGASADLVGFRTSVNRDSGFASSNGVPSGAQLNFKVPSYASGIIAPIGQPNFGPIAANTPQTKPQPPSPPPAGQQQFVPNAKIPTIEEGKILFAQKPVDGLLPPLFPDQLPPVYRVEVGTERSTIFPRDPFATPANTQNGVGFKTDVNQQTQFPQTQTSYSTTPTTANRFSGSVVPQQQPAISGGSPTAPPIQKYTGGFGGPAGFLGNQQNIGTAYTSTARPIVQPQAPVPRPNPVPLPPQGTFQTSPRPVEQTTINRYTGSFGGPPGFLGNQQNIGTAYTKQPASSTPSVQFQQRPAQPAQPTLSQGPPPVSAPTVAVPSGPTSNPYNPQQQQQQPAGSVRPTSPPNKFTGSFGFGPVNQGPNAVPVRPTVSSFIPQQPQQTPQPIRPQSFNGGNKFTGSFGGAPGLLGNQQSLGTHVKPDGTVLAPSAPGAGFTVPQQSTAYPQQQQYVGASAQQQNPAATGGNKFTGSFGGPPGVLRPFDNAQG
ncbi:uncharacterized protein LOC126578542 [Anopheles aquasalis]|uniref:uncharacterized protein LOC126578542 n=1 Tax=Anopheles aquasalis TaxID=42839 RepID=UPI00215AF60A|nr:uncharacterized protein LOC126578542 [Anopheles aquasalis]